MARCLEINFVSDTAFSIVSSLQEWQAIKESARKVERLNDLDNWQGWTGIYLVQPASGPERHYIVAED